MPDRRKLTDAGIARLRAGAREYTVWDTQIAGLGVRVRPSGSRTFIYHRKTASGVRKMSFGPAALSKVEEVRRACMEAAASGNAGAGDGSRVKAPLFRDFVAGPWRTDRFARCKPSTQRNFNGILERQLLPAFGARRVDRITRRAVIRWFEACSRTAPGTANAALDLLGHILNHALALGHAETNPTRGIERNTGRKMTRFLSREEIARLHRVLDRHAEGSQSEAQQVDTIRLLLLTGCRKGEIMRLRREEVKGDRLELRDSKTGPRTVLLNGPAREIVARRMAEGPGSGGASPGPRSGGTSSSPWLFPSVRDPSRPQCRGLPLWYRARREAGIEDVRLHDLRHTVASQAAMNGVPLPTVARLLGHSNVRMTMRYAHVGDREVEAAAERVGRAIMSMMGGTENLPSCGTG
ncbi:MAG: tyrosine-type recombinase/integrase [Alphaproteobacteria bacterium]|nr:tyrosine-type recombinase/integrase [Alphaproteobacteria bacterium]